LKYGEELPLKHGLFERPYRRQVRLHTQVVGALLFIEKILTRERHRPELKTGILGLLNAENQGIEAQVALCDREVVRVKNLVPLPAEAFIQRLSRQIQLGSRQIDPGYSIGSRSIYGSF
jgi:hypothetical protein